MKLAATRRISGKVLEHYAAIRTPVSIASIITGLTQNFAGIVIGEKISKME
jgi:hypothetical protein